MKTTGVSLLLVLILFIAIEVVRFRGAMVQDLSVLASVIGMNAGPALIFDDQSAAAETLSALSSQEHVMAAVIYGADDQVFARYNRAGVGEFRH